MGTKQSESGGEGGGREREREWVCTQCYYWSGRERNGAKEGGGDDEESSNSQRWQKSCPVPPFFVLNFMDFKAERGNWQVATRGKNQMLDYDCEL